VGRLVVGVVIAIAVGVALAPVYWMVATSFKGQLAATSLTPSFVPTPPTGKNYTGLFTGSLPFGNFLINSVVTSVIAAAFAVVVATMAAYSFSRGRYRLRNPLSLVVLATQMLPLVVLIGPLYLLLLDAHLLNTYLGLIIGYTTFAVPFAAWMMKGFIDAVPIEVEEAARIDGYSRFGILTRVVVPLTLPGLLTTGVFVFINSWNNLLFPLTLMSSNTKLTLPPGILQGFTGQLKTDWGGMMAASCITAIPIIIAFFAVQKSMIKGMTQGAVTGQ
jgi:ABC-type glycerol-3-phosphate transport system permease component